jgi:hypothetical protein
MDETRTSTPIDLMALHGIIDADGERAAGWFSYCAKAVLGPPALFCTGHRSRAYPCQIT